VGGKDPPLPPGKEEIRSKNKGKTDVQSIVSLVFKRVLAGCHKKMSLNPRDSGR